MKIYLLIYFLLYIFMKITIKLIIRKIPKLKLKFRYLKWKINYFQIIKLVQITSKPSFVISETLFVILYCPNETTGFYGFLIPKSNFLAFDMFPNLSPLPFLLRNYIPWINPSDM